ncbi:cell surface protein [Methanosarcina siciliae T4/M]|uniref:Cell surface protein n=1 Tax=Methanosarcina siciliae T4/M TaxID=1434120 RepID=A0A0E3P7T4_9EURY|nr:NosD domain-containing protein [Methanosarcina siciliae]AKB29892.1 cell surface protein [Methanosarcina siciliae T4/M]
MILLKTIRNVKICFAIGFVLLLLSSGTSTARRITVGSDENQDFSSIQEAVNAASPGDTVYVYKGLYMENIYLDKEITVRSISGIPDMINIKAKNPNDHVFHVNANNVTISGFYINGASDPLKAGIYLENTHGILISNNKLSNNHLGIYLDSSTTNMLNLNNVSGNEVGIFLKASKDNWVINNKVKMNSLDGILLEASDENHVTGNLLNYNVGYGFVLSNSSRNLIYNNFFQNNVNVGYEGTNSANSWNMTREKGINIVGGPYIGGNYWTGPESTALCAIDDQDNDGFCDVSYDLGEGNIDYMPLIRHSSAFQGNERSITVSLIGFALFVFAVSIFIVKKVMSWGKGELPEDDVK